MKIIHLSAECYPAAKVGGLGDVVGALPKYLSQLGMDAGVILPKYRTDWLENQEFETIFEGKIKMGPSVVPFAVQKESKDMLGFPLYVVNIPAYFNYFQIYGDVETKTDYFDQTERYIAFQVAALQWLKTLAELPDVLHCHDHQTALVPFMVKYCAVFKELAEIPTVLTVHNAEYQGFDKPRKKTLLPSFAKTKAGLLNWNGQFNSLAAGLKCCSRITTVSPSYMKELQQRSNGLEPLFQQKKDKSCGIINGIDTAVWDSRSDGFLQHHYTVQTVTKGKAANKKLLCERFNLDANRPLISFIGRIVEEKGADLLPDLFASVLKDEKNVSFMVLGTGQGDLEKRFKKMRNRFVGYFDASIDYNEELAHQIYAGSDFMIIPSRVEPCGLNQLYAMRYGTIPIVRNVGGLKDTVRDISKADGYGIAFQSFGLKAAKKALKRASDLYQKSDVLHELRQKVMKINFSWNVSAKAYIDMYKQLNKHI